MTFESSAKRGAPIAKRTVKHWRIVIFLSIFTVLHCLVEPLLAALLGTALFGGVAGIILFASLYTWLILKNRSFWHNAVTDADPVVEIGARILCGALVISYTALAVVFISNAL